MQEITVQEILPEHFILDVRDQWEFDISHIPGATLIPLAELETRYGELPKDKKIVVHCHYGGRSARATLFLQRKGFDVCNLTGGLDAYADVHPEIKKY